MIECAACSRWFHLACQGLTQPIADALAWWHCPICVEKGQPEAPIPVLDVEEDWMEESKLTPEYSAYLDKRLKELQEMLDIFEMIPLSRSKSSVTSSQSTSLKRKSSVLDNSQLNSSSNVLCAICNTKRRHTMLQCVSCSFHFHIDCASIDNDQAPFIRSYRCDSCTHNQEINRSLTYCVCHGLDDGRQMVQCEKCTEWYHCECLSIAPPSEDEQFVCSTCIEMGAEIGSLDNKKKRGKLNHSRLLLNSQPKFCYCHANLHDPRTMVRCNGVECEKRFFHYQCAKVAGEADKPDWLCVECEIKKCESELANNKAELEELKAELSRRNGGMLPASFNTPNALLCICREVFDPLRPMVICKACLMEYHHPCVQYDPNDNQPFTCQRCLKKGNRTETKE